MSYTPKAKRYLPIPNEVFDISLSGGEILVYAYLMYRENRKTFKCYPSYTTIGKAVGMSKNTVRKYVSMLEDKQLIATESTTIRRRDGAVRNGTLCYTILPIKEAVDCYYKRQMKENDERIARERVQNAIIA